MPTHIKVLAFLTLLFYIVHLVFNAFAGIGGSRLFPKSVGEISKKFSLIITPVPRTFAIWGVIFTLQLCWIIYAIATVFLSSPTANILSDAFYIAFILNIILITLWLITWARKEGVYSFAVIFIGQIAVAVSIGFAMNDLKEFLDHNSVYCIGNTDIWIQRILVQNGLLFYATWTMIATLLNLAVVMVYYIGLSQRKASMLTLSLLGAVTVIWFILENTILVEYASFSFAVYIVLVIGLSGIISTMDKLVRNFTAGLLILSAIFFLVRIIRMSTYDPCLIFKANNTMIANGTII